ncbi:hypothetical protein FRC0405_01748 [Corynebacterium diphtheriae]|nr:hypothetical protein FRC0405_01748 [Corynebacterium diphtheriae]
MGALIGVIAGLVVTVLGFLLSNLPGVAQVFLRSSGHCPASIWRGEGR